MKILTNVLLYQAVWFLCVFLGNQGALIGIILILMHLLFSPCKRNDLKMMAALLLMGGIIDGTLTTIGFMSFNVPALPIPFWLAIVWLALATLPNHSLEWLKGRLGLASLFGSIGGPLAYWAGVKAGAASFGQQLIPSLITLALIWAALWPAAMYFANKDLPHAKRDYYVKKIH